MMSRPSRFRYAAQPTLSSKILNAMPQPALPAANCSVLAEVRLVQTPMGRILRVETCSECIADHFWLQRERFLQLTEGASSLEVHWFDRSGAEPVILSYAPQLPETALAV
jgi:hypothetical protein